MLCHICKINVLTDTFKCSIDIVSKVVPLETNIFRHIIHQFTHKRYWECKELLLVGILLNVKKRAILKEIYIWFFNIYIGSSSLQSFVSSCVCFLLFIGHFRSLPIPPALKTLPTPNHLRNRAPAITLTYRRKIMKISILIFSQFGCFSIFLDTLIKFVSGAPSKKRVYFLGIAQRGGGGRNPCPNGLRQ